MQVKRRLMLVALVTMLLFPVVPTHANRDKINTTILCLIGGLAVYALYTQASVKEKQSEFEKSLTQEEFKRYREESKCFDKSFFLTSSQRDHLLFNEIFMLKKQLAEIKKCHCQSAD